MSRFQELKGLFKRRLINAARRDLFGHFERSISGVEKEIDHKRKLLDLVLNPDIKLQEAVYPANVKKFMVNKEVPPEQQERSSSLDQEEPEPPHIKEEQEELWTSQEGEQLQGLEEAGITSSPVSVKKSEDDEEKPQCLQLHHRQTKQMRTEADEVSEPDRHLHPDTDDKMSSERHDNDKDMEEPDGKSFK